MPNEKPRYHVLAALGFSVAFFGAVLMGTRVWFSTDVYLGNIREYEPINTTGMKLSAIGAGILAVYMGVVGHRRRELGSYLLGGCLGVPVAFVGLLVVVGFLRRSVGHSLRAGILVDSLCAGLCLLLAFGVHWWWLRRATD